jgi:hypothetical protein
MPRPLTVLAIGIFVALTLALISEGEAQTNNGRGKLGQSVKADTSQRKANQMMKGSAKSKKPSASRATQAQLGTSFRFDGSSLQGKLQSAPSTTATIEDDKFLDDLLASRRNFRDRISEDEMRY